MQQPTPGPLSVSVELSEVALCVVRSAVAESIAPSADRRDLHAAVCALAREARTREVAPERLLICFKSLWNAEATAHPVADRRSQTELFDQMVSLCIREYFA